MLEKKRTKKDRFSGQKRWTGRGNGQSAQPARVPVNRLHFLGRGPIKKGKKSSLSSSNLSFPIEGYVFPAEGYVFQVEGYVFLVEVRSRSGRGLTIVCHAFNAQQLVNRSTPSSTGRGYFLAFWLSRLETYKLRASLHLWVKKHMHLFIYLLVLASKALILSLVH